MDSLRVLIGLVPGPEDAPLDSEEYQAELDGFASNLREVGLNPSAMVKLIEADGAAAPYLGEFYLAIKSSLTVAVPVIVAWLHGRSGRKVKIKVSDVEVEASSMKEVEALLKQAQAFKEANEPKRVYER